jgi:hypothetical protein
MPNEDHEGPICKSCGEPFSPRQANQRFCSSGCNHAWFAEERRLAVQAFRQSQTEEAQQ